MAYFLIDLRDKVAQRVTAEAESRPPRFIKVEANSLADAIETLRCSHPGCRRLSEHKHTDHE